MDMNFQAYMTFFVTMIAIINPIGDLAIFIGLMSGTPAKEQRKTALEASLAVFVILLMSIWLGTLFLDFFGITSSSFEAAGGFVLLLLGIGMVNGNDTDTGTSSQSYTLNEEKEGKKLVQKKKKVPLAIVPLAIPIAVGPGAIAACIIHAQRFHGMLDKILLSATSLLLASVTCFCFYFASVVSKFLGVTGVKVTTRIMGMVLMAIAFGMMSQGIGEMLPGLR